MPSKKRPSLSTDDDEKPDLSDSAHMTSSDEADPSFSPKAKKPRGAPASPGKSDSKPDKFSQKGKGRPWTSAEYVQLFQRVEDLGKKAAFEGFPGRTKNQAYQAWRNVVAPACIKALETKGM
ncbi:hypothetical protein A1Q1_00195 [Trichosporon asahii var. asahii CBS 2479]|uniref:Myb-like domain-containing protein n=1 Tax=Trichosporon asahii var. asahii (strain ATCC 90039 / CBS 2479 / JCM 2466 / KCTC 7840 / NBRC 103889/ NCYC 2677 / UAMH 7654) TaxID=1186058 RepID=J6F5F3_TRIAS|nr:hypothetical protein A1Q1_00195 [Trichosporon asahii var. asahii CBS 2479]EJT50497.1 hypothetical protein A1Q1_00195 [Trichosporon asahii var. asahii CBS 2479]